MCVMTYDMHVMASHVLANTWPYRMLRRTLHSWLPDPCRLLCHHWVCILHVQYSLWSVWTTWTQGENSLLFIYTIICLFNKDFCITFYALEIVLGLEVRTVKDIGKDLAFQRLAF